jgi:hypothetical protein
MRKTLLALAVLAAGAMTMGISTDAFAGGGGKGGKGGGGGGKGGGGGGGWSHHHHHHHGGFIGGGLFLVPLMAGSCYSNCRAYHGPRYCHAKCD